MLALIPKSIPNLATLLDDVAYGRMSDGMRGKLAKALGVQQQTLEEWIKQDDAPRVVLLAIFWLTSFGRSIVHCAAHNDAVMFATHVRSLKDQIQRLEQQLKHVGDIGSFGSANDPVPGVLPGAAVASGVVTRAGSAREIGGAKAGAELRTRRPLRARRW